MRSEILSVNNIDYQVIRLLGKGKGGYSYLVTDGNAQYVLKQIHHEPCSYYTFGNKLETELRDYETLSRIGIPMPQLLAVDSRQERILKTYIDGKTIFDLAYMSEWDFEHWGKKYWSKTPEFLQHY